MAKFQGMHIAIGLVLMASVAMVVGVLGEKTEEERKEEAEVRAGFKGGVPLRRAAAAARSLREERRDPTTQYVLVSGPDKRTRALCYSRGRCFLKRLTCPTTCPRRDSSSSSAGACFIDCHPSKCETSCRSRKPKCNGFGAVCYDPRFVGGDGVMFYFHGKANENFCLLSDSDLHVNAHFIGTRPLDRKRDFTWIDALGIMFDDYKLSIGTKKKLGAWNEDVDRFVFSYDDQEFTIPLGESSAWQTPDGGVQIERTDKVNSANIIIAGLMSLDVSIVPITEEDNTKHNYRLNLTEDCFAHLDIQFKFTNLSSIVDGVLGQTYRPDFKNPVKVGTPMPIMGGESNFFTTTLFGSDCKANKFKIKRGTMEQQKLIGEKAFQCSSTKMEGGGVLCKR